MERLWAHAGRRFGGPDLDVQDEGRDDDDGRPPSFWVFFNPIFMCHTF